LSKIVDEELVMRRIAIILLTLTLLFLPYIGSAQDETQDEQNYRSELLGLAFQHPADWIVQDQEATHTVTASSKADMEAVSGGKAPGGLLFSITISSFRVIGVERVEDFSAILKKVAQAPDAAPKAIRIDGNDGLVVDTVDSKQDVATRTVILSIGKRRVAVIRGVATVSSWTTGGSEGRFDDLVETLRFFPATGIPGGDTFGQVLWQLAADKLTDLVDVSVSGDGSRLYVTERTQGIWEVDANGTAYGVNKPVGMGAFGGTGLLRAGILYVADPVQHAIWTVNLEGGIVTLALGGRAGSERGAFGANSPQYFAFGLRGLLYVLDENEGGLRIQVFNRAGEWAATWDLTDGFATPIERPVISSDENGNVYLVGRNTPGIVKVNPAGKVVTTELGSDVLANSGAQALVVDRFGNFFVATADQGIFNLSADGKLLGIIGEGYDEAAPPKPGQLGKPVGMAVGEGGRVLYVADSGKYPQIVAFALNGNASLNATAGTREAREIIYGETVTGEIGEKTFIDLYKFNGKVGDVITITMTAGDGSKIDPYLELLGLTRQRVAANDDAKADDLGKTTAQIKSYRLPFNGTYYIRATRFGAETTSATGTYKLTLTLDRISKGKN
jgi:hypothetical protein